MQTLVVITNIEVDRKDLELIEASRHKTLQDAILAIEEATNSQNHKDFGIYTMSDFMDIANNQEMNLENHWLGYIFCEDSNPQLMVTLKGLCDE